MNIAMRSLYVASLVCAASSAQAALTEFRFTESYLGTAPANAAPWIVASFADNAAPGSVRLTLTTGGLSGIENLSRIYFNLDPAINPVALSFNYVSGLMAARILQGKDDFKAEADGKYDVLFRYRDQQGFNSNLNSVYDIFGPGLTAQSFNFLSTPAGQFGPFLSAALIDHTGGGVSSGLIAVSAVPLPAAAWLFISGVAGLAAFGRRRANSSQS